MSDVILPPPRSSSGAPDGNRSDSSTFETDHDTSLITSSGSESKEDPSNKSGSRSDAKQKRKRTRYVLGLCRPLHIKSYSRNWNAFCYYFQRKLTYCSTKDQAILEAEYKENPKPNKAARAVIVQKVDLNEKEVQVRITPYL